VGETRAAEVLSIGLGDALVLSEDHAASEGDVGRR
jgi:hypothetical protein